MRWENDQKKENWFSLLASKTFLVSVSGIRLSLTLPPAYTKLNDGCGD